MRRRALLIGMIGLVGTGGAIGCSGDDDTTALPTTATTAATAAATATAASAAPGTTTASAPTTTAAPPTTTTAAAPTSTAGPSTTASPTPVTDAAPVETTVAVPTTAPATTVAPPRPEGAEPPCTSEALDAAAGPASAHTWDDLACVAGYAHAYLTGGDPSAPAPEVVFLGRDGRWRELARGVELDGSPDLAGVPPEVLDAFQLIGPQPSLPEGAPCDADALAAAAASIEPGTALSEVRCAGDYARARAPLGAGATLDLLFGAGPAGWRELASAPDLAATGAVAVVPTDLRAQLGL